MPSQRVVVTLAVLLGSCCISAYPVRPESDSAHGTNAPRVSCFVLVTVSPFNPDLYLQIFTCLMVQLALCLRASLWQDSSHPGTSTRLCLRWGKGLVAREIKALSRRMSQTARWKTLMKSYGRWWQWVSTRARDLPRQSRPLGNPARELASGNTVSANEGYRTGSASHSLPLLPAIKTPHLAVGDLNRALKGLWSLGGKRGAGLQHRRGIVGYRDSPIRIWAAGHCFSHTREPSGPMSRQSCHHGLADTHCLPPGAE